MQSATGPGGDELRNRFGTAFAVVEEHRAIRLGRLTRLALFHLVRRGVAPEGDTR
jgi:hypothetical protein